MWLIQILLPLYDNSGRRISSAHFRRVKKELTERFHGLTAFSRSVAEGFWDSGRARHLDDIIVYEVMATSQGTGWWKKYRKILEGRFRQEAIVIRAQRIRVL